MPFLNPTIAKTYKSLSQKTRVMTEFWTGENIYCPNCGNDISVHPNNNPVGDFFCSNCNEDYELKSGKKKTIGNKIPDGAYATMIERLQSFNNPNFFFLTYAQDLKINNFLVIPKHYFVPEIIEKRTPLPETARRAGWIGCNITLKGIPESGKIFYIKNGETRNRKNVLNDWKKTLFLRNSKNLEGKGWIIDIMKCIDMLGKKEFNLDEMYNFEGFLKTKYPNNNFIKDKIRQQLQFLRNKGYLEFLGRGRYRVL